jgi:hypothetical protein
MAQAALAEQAEQARAALKVLVDRAARAALKVLVDRVDRAHREAKVVRTKAAPVRRVRAAAARRCA